MRARWRTLLIIASAIVVVLATLTIGIPTSTKHESSTYSSVITSIRYEDPREHQMFREALERAQVPVTVERRDGKDYFTWPREHDAAVTQIASNLFGDTPPRGRSISMQPKEELEEFKNWLRANDIRFTTQISHGREFVVWEAADTARVERWPRWRGIPEPPSQPR
jgi:hypothetical protein